MDERLCHPVSQQTHTLEVSRSIRDLPPVHYTFKVESFSRISEILSASEEAKYESNIFESGGYKWKMSFYPNGRTERNGDGHISLYLVIAETETFPLGWEVNVSYRLFVLDQIRDKYLTIEDANGNVRRFHAMRTEWGFSQLISLATFNDASNGYLIDDSCVFGAEIFVLKCTGKGECLSMQREPTTSTYTWKIEKFWQSNKNIYVSKEFTVGERKWILKLYPKILSDLDGKCYVKLSLSVCDWKTHHPKGKLYAKYTLRIRDQIKDAHAETTEYDWFTVSVKGNCFTHFLLFDDLNDASNGFLVKDTLIVEAGIQIISVVENFTEED